MTYCILFLLGLVILWIGIKTADEVHRLALTSTAILPLSWGYFFQSILIPMSEWNPDSVCLSSLHFLQLNKFYGLPM